MFPESDHQGFGESSATPIIIAGGEGEVLPRLSHEALCDLLRRLPDEELAVALRSRILRAVSLPGVVFHAACGSAGLRLARARGLGVVAYAEAAELVVAARAVRGAQLLREATSGLARRWPMFSANRRTTAPQLLAMALAVTFTGVAALLLPGKLEAMSAAAKRFARPGAAERAADLLEECVGVLEQ